MEMLYSVDLRYAGQGSELVLPVRKGAGGGDLSADFHAAHQQTYGHSRPAHPVELVNVRVAAIGRLETPRMAPQGANEASSAESRRSVYFGGRMQASAILQRAGLRIGSTVVGPAIIEEFGSTTVLPPAWACRVDEAGNLRLSPGRS
jgi:N-methylhydantoinase A